MLTTMAAAHHAAACPAPQPQPVALTLLTPDNATISAGDGALLVQRSGDDGEKAWTVRTHGGAAVKIDIQPLADGLERWRLDSPASELEIVDETGAVIAHIHQDQKKKAALPAPRIRRLTSTAASPNAVPYGVPASLMALDLAAAPPKGATMLVAELVSGSDAMGWFVLAAPAAKHVERETYASKGCGRGSSPVIAGTRLRFAWLDATGRLSRFTRAVSVARAHK